MKTLLIFALISICVMGLYSKEIAGALGITEDASAKPITLDNLIVDDGKHHAMTAQELTELAKKDPEASRKFVESHQLPEDRSEVDKLMNLFARGKYE